MSKNASGEIELAIRVTGIQDIYRFASHMLTGQVEFCREGRAALWSLRNRIEARQWNYMLTMMGGPATKFFRPKRLPGELPSDTVNR